MRYAKILLFAALIALAACSKSKESEYIVAQEKTIDTYWEKMVVNNTDIFEKTIADNIFRIVLKKGDETAIAAGDTVSFYYTGAILTANGIAIENIFDTNIPEVAAELGITTSELAICKDIVGAGNFISGLEKGLLQMHKGEIAQIIFTSSYGFGDKIMNTIPAYSPIIFQVEIVDVITQ